MTDGQTVAAITGVTALLGGVGLFIRNTAGERSESKGGKKGDDSGASYLQAGDMRELMVVLRQLRDNMEPMRELPELIRLMHGEIAGVRLDVQQLDDRTQMQLDALALAARNPEKARSA
jgi:hypothetical protein